MRGFRKRNVAFVAALTLLVVACGDDDGSEPANTTTNETGQDGSSVSSISNAPADEPADNSTAGDSDGPDNSAAAATGGTLRVVRLGEPATMNPVKSVVGDANIWGTMFDRLIFVDEDLVLTDSGLITTWETTDDATWRFTTREGVEFHNGEAWNAEALKFTLDEYRLNPDGIMAGFLAGVTDVNVVDEHTVDVVMQAPNGAIPSLMSTLYALPPGYYAEVGETEFQAAPVGTGAFVFDNYAPGVSIDVIANENYWRGRPSLDGLHFTWAPDEATRVALLESDEADVVFSVSVNSADRLSETDGVGVHSVRTANSLTFFLVDSRPPFDDPVVREAVVRAIDRQAIVDAVFEGVGAETSTGILAPLDSRVMPPDDLYDPELARELVASMDEVPVIPFTYQVGRTLGDEDVAEIVAGMIESVGFKVERNPGEYAAVVGAAIAGELNGLFDTGTVPVYYHPDVYANAFLSPEVSLTKSCKSDPRLDELRLEGVSTLDPEAAAEIYSELDALATTEVMCIFPTYLMNENLGVSDDVAEFELAVKPDLIVDWFLVSL